MTSDLHAKCGILRRRRERAARCDTVDDSRDENDDCDRCSGDHRARHGSLASRLAQRPVTRAAASFHRIEQKSDNDCPDDGGSPEHEPPQIAESLSLNTRGDERRLQLSLPARWSGRIDGLQLIEPLLRLLAEEVIVSSR